MKKQTTLFIATALFALAGCSTSVPIKNFEQNLIPQTSKIININQRLKMIYRAINNLAAFIVIIEELLR